MASGSQSRSRFAGTSQQLCDALLPFVTSKTWLVYDEAEKVKDTKTCPETITKHKDIVKTLHGLQPNFSFVRGTVCEAMTLIFDSKVETLKLKADYKAEWVETHSRRMMNLTHVVGQASTKKTAAAWFAKLGLDSSARPSQPSPAQASWVHGFNVEGLAGKGRGRGKEEDHDQGVGE